MSDPMEVAREGFFDAESGEPLFEDAEPLYAMGWCIYHDCAHPYGAFAAPDAGVLEGETAP